MQRNTSTVISACSHIGNDNKTLIFYLRFNGKAYIFCPGHMCVFCLEGSLFYLLFFPIYTNSSRNPTNRYLRTAENHLFLVISYFILFYVIYLFPFCFLSLIREWQPLQELEFQIIRNWSDVPGHVIVLLCPVCTEFTSFQNRNELSLPRLQWLIMCFGTVFLVVYSFVLNSAENQHLIKQD